MKTEINPQEDAQNIFEDILEERKGFEYEVYGMSKEDALKTVEAYGYQGKMSKEISEYLWSLAEGI